MNQIPKKLQEEISRWIDERRYGNLQINFQDGKIVNINVSQSIKVEAIGIVVGTTKVIVNGKIDV